MKREQERRRAASPIDNGPKLQRDFRGSRRGPRTADQRRTQAGIRCCTSWQRGQAESAIVFDGRNICDPALMRLHGFPVPRHRARSRPGRGAQGLGERQRTHDPRTDAPNDKGRRCSAAPGLKEVWIESDFAALGHKTDYCQTGQQHHVGFRLGDGSNRNIIHTEAYGTVVDLQAVRPGKKTAGEAAKSKFRQGSRHSLPRWAEIAPAQRRWTQARYLRWYWCWKPP